MATIIIIVTLGIISRYVFDSPIAWVEELGIFLFVWVCFLGANVTAAKKNHIAIDLVARMIQERKKILLNIFFDILILVFCIVLAIGAFKLQPQTIGHSSVSLNIPKNLYYLPALITAIYMFIVFSCDMIEQLENVLKKGSTN